MAHYIKSYGIDRGFVRPFTGVNILPLFEPPGGRNLLDSKVKTRKKMDPPKFFFKFSKVNIFPYYLQ